ncbi:MAG: hypothetical protein GX595_09235, partial [Lentisphaerae bacterium]|nr:hypothetical protein [Lentisphaerota bacterium]
MAESIVEAVVRILRRQIARGRRTVPLTPAVQAALFTPAPVAAPSRPAARPAAPQGSRDEASPPAPAVAAAPPRPAPSARPAPAPPPAAPAGPALSAAEWPAPPALDLSQSDWQALRDLVTPCRRCPLCQERTQTVFGEGPADAELMFIGEAPGRDEDLQGR